MLKSLGQMAPTLSTDYPVSGTNGDTKPLADNLQKCPGGAHIAYLPYVGIRQLSSWMKHPAYTCSMSILIGHVLFWCRPTKVRRPIVVFVSVAVSRLMEPRWLRSVERGAYDDVYTSTPSGAKVDHLIFAALDDWLQHYTATEAAPAVNSRVMPVYGSHTPTARRFIAWVSRYFAPLFSFPDHAAVLQQGAT